MVKPCIRLEGGEHPGPSINFREALTRRHPGLFTPDPGRNYAQVRVVPRCRGDHRGDCGRHVRRGAWYDVVHAYPVLSSEFSVLSGSERVCVWYQPIGDPVAYLPAPPQRSFEERLAELPRVPEPDTEAVQFFGSRDEARRWIENNRRSAVRDDRSAGRWDWDAAADAYAPVLAGIEALKLDPAQRAQQADVRVWKAELELANARASRTRLRRNAGWEPHLDDMVADENSSEEEQV